MSLSGAFSEGAQALLTRLAEIKFLAPITAGSLSYIAARQRWMDWQMRIFKRNTFNVVAKSIAPGIRVFHAYVPTALPMDYAEEATDTAPLIRHSQSLALDSSDSESEIEPQPSGDEHPCRDDSSSAPTLIVSSPGDDTEVQSSTQSNSEQSTRSQLARRRITTTAMHTESSTSQRNSQMPIMHTDPNDPLPTPQLTNGNSLTGSQDRQRAPSKHSRCCLESYTENDSSTSETLDEEGDYGSFGIGAILQTDSDHARSTHEHDRQD